MESLTTGILFTDAYQLTMAQVYYRMGIHERPALFEHIFAFLSRLQFTFGGFCISAGLETLLEWMPRARFGDAEIDVLRGMTARNGARLFANDFLGWLRKTARSTRSRCEPCPKAAWHIRMCR